MQTFSPGGRVRTRKGEEELREPLALRVGKKKGAKGVESDEFGTKGRRRPKKSWVGGDDCRSKDSPVRSREEQKGSGAALRGASGKETLLRKRKKGFGRGRGLPSGGDGNSIVVRGGCSRELLGQKKEDQPSSLRPKKGVFIEALGPGM